MTNTKLMNMLLCAAALVGINTVNAAAPLTDDGPTVSADGDAKAALVKYGLPLNLKALPANATVTMVRLIGPVKTAESWLAAADEVIAQWMAHGVITNSTSPTGFRLAGPGLGWTNLVYSTGAPLHNGQLNPVAPYDHELGEVEWVLVAVESAGGNDVSLDMLSVSATSTGGALNDTVTFVGLQHTPRAPLVLADGTVVTTGPTSQLGNRTAALVMTRKFNGGGTQAGLDEVRNYIRDLSPYSLTNTAQLIGSDASRVSSVHSTDADTTPPVAPILIIRNNGTNQPPMIWLEVSNSKTNGAYHVLSRSLLNTGRWQSVGYITGTNRMQISPASGQRRFYAVRILQ